MKELPKILIALLISLLLMLVFGEVATRLYTAAFTFYDIEMSRYANELKIPSSNTTPISGSGGAWSSSFRPQHQT